MQTVDGSGLSVIFRNPEPKRELQYPGVWLLITQDRKLNIFVSHDDATQPRVVRKEAA